MADDPRAYLEDAAHYPGGHAAGIVFPRTTAEVADAIATAGTVLPIGAQSSLTGGATPMGELLLATAMLSRIVGEDASHLTVEAGVPVAAMQEHLAARGAWFPPAPTFSGAFAGGIVSTNAAGAATFKYGTTRDWVDAITVVLADGTILELHRGMHHARDGRFELTTRSGVIGFQVPRYRMPAVAKRSAGYFAAENMDLVDLFVGAEGTLGVVTEITFRVLAPAPQSALALVQCRSESEAIALTAVLREASAATWASGDRDGIDAAAIENMDARSLDILRADGADEKNHVTLRESTRVALLVQLELHGETATHAFADIENALEPDARDSQLTRFCRLLDDRGLLDATELALPSDHRRLEQLAGIREAVPAGVNRRVGDAKRSIDPRIEKTAADMIVPFERFAEMMDLYRRGFEKRGLDFAIWGHISDGNVHPNVIPRSYRDVVDGKAAILEFGQEVARMAGCPLAEHGVGRNPVKQELLRQLYGNDGIAQMRAVKRALDPQSKLGPGVIFPR